MKRTCAVFFFYGHFPVWVILIGIWQVFMTRPTTLSSVVKSSVVKMLDSAIKESDSQSLQRDPCMAGEPTPKTSTIPSIPKLEANSQSGMGTSKTYDPRFRVPGSMQIVGPTLSEKTTWLSKLIQDAATHF